MKKPCIHCEHPVGGGGNAHPNGHCPPNPKPGDNRRSRIAKKRRKARKGDTFIPVRGRPVAGIHKVSASSGEARGGKNRGKTA